MATTTFSLDNFRAAIFKNSLARTNRFEVEIVPPPGISSDSGRLINLYCEQTNFPPLNLSVKSFKIFGPSYQRPITSEYGGDGLSMVFHLDRDMEVRKVFEKWLHLIVDPVTFTVAYQKEYATTVRIKQHDEAGNITHSVELREAFPRSMNIMELNHSSTNQTHRLNVLFAYRYWRPIYTDNTTPVQVPKMVRYPQVVSQDNRLTSGLTAEQANDYRAAFAAVDPRRTDR